MKAKKEMHYSQENHHDVLRTAVHMEDIKLQDVTVLDLRGKSSITDYYLIATVNSYGQLKGAVKQLHDYFYQEAIECRGGKKQSEEENWTLLDCEYFIIHLMTKEAREFYDLEKLWFEAPAIKYTEELSALGLQGAKPEATEPETTEPGPDESAGKPSGAGR